MLTALYWWFRCKFELKYFLSSFFSLHNWQNNVILILNDFLVLQFRKKIGIFLQAYLYFECFKSNSKTVHYGNSNTLLFYQIYKDSYFSKTLWFIITILQIENFAIELIFPNKSIYFKDPMVKKKGTLEKTNQTNILKRNKGIFNKRQNSLSPPT